MCFSNSKGSKNNFYKLFRVTFHMIYSMSGPDIKAVKKHKNSVHKHNEFNVDGNVTITTKRCRPFIWITQGHPTEGVANGKIRALPRRRDPSLKIRARDLNLFAKSEPET